MTRSSSPPSRSLISSSSSAPSRRATSRQPSTNWVSSIGVNKVEDCSAATITERRILFQPETERVVVGQTTNKDGKIVQKYVVAKSLIKDVLFEETHENTMKKSSSSGTGESEQGSGNGGNTGGSTNGGSTGDNGGYNGGGGDGGDDLDKD